MLKINEILNKCYSTATTVSGIAVCAAVTTFSLYVIRCYAKSALGLTKKHSDKETKKAKKESTKKNADIKA